VGIPHGTRSRNARAPWEINLQKAGKIGADTRALRGLRSGFGSVASLDRLSCKIRILHVGDRRWGVEMMAVMVCLGSSDGGCAVYFTLLYFAALRYVTSCGSAMI